jgi:hypothetical protein
MTRLSDPKPVTELDHLFADAARRRQVRREAVRLVLLVAALLVVMQVLYWRATGHL